MNSRMSSFLKGMQKDTILNTISTVALDRTDQNTASAETLS